MMKRFFIWLSISIVLTTSVVYATTTGDDATDPYTPNIRDHRVIQRAEKKLHVLIEDANKEQLVYIIGRLYTAIDTLKDAKSQYLLYTLLTTTQAAFDAVIQRTIATYTGDSIDTGDQTITGAQMTGVVQPEIVVVPGTAEEGKASYYGAKFHGRRTANGDVFDKDLFTAAAPTRYAFGTHVKVTNKKNGLRVVVKINDRGGFEKIGRIIDLSEAAFKAINNDSLRAGILDVILEIVSE